MRILPLILFTAFFTHIAVAADAPLRWWKGNLHTHSLWSDGDDYPEMIVDWYKEHGYHFLALSDHNILSDHERWLTPGETPAARVALEKYLKRFGRPWVEEREAEGVRQVRLKTLPEFRVPFEEADRFLLIQSEEITSRYLTAPIHINATNVREKIVAQTGTGVVDVIQKTLDAVAEQRRRTGVPMFAHINHPNFGWALTAEELMQLENNRFFEVYNGHPLVHNEGDATHAATDRVWDIILTERLAELGKEPLLGLATDDSHNYHGIAGKESHSGRGWIMVRAESLKTGALIAAMEAGDFYASSGVGLSEVTRGNTQLSLKIEAEPGLTYTTEFIGTRKGYERGGKQVLGEDGRTLRVTRQYSTDIGAVLSRVEGEAPVYTLKGDEIYVRARVISSRLKADPYLAGEHEQAWTQPLVTGVK